MGRALACGLSLACGLALAACHGPHPPGSDTSRPASPPPRAGVARWPFWPTGMRFHPLSRLVMNASTGEAIIEARLEFVDPEGATSKAWGQLTVEMYDASPAGDPTTQGVWSIDLTQPRINVDRFDDVTRTYLIRLQVEAGQVLPIEPRLEATFDSADGRQLQAAILLRTR